MQSKTNPIKYSIVIPTYNHCDDLLKPCVETIFKYSKMGEVELIISANGCVDNTKLYLNTLRMQFDMLGFSENFKMVWHDKALGYSRACNEGIKLATTDKIVLLNNDILLLPQNRQTWLELLNAPFDLNPKCGVSCVVKGPSAPAGRDFAIFFCVMIHRKVFEKIGLLNEEYGVGGGEDTEFCIEAEDAGFEVCVALETQWNQNIGMHTGNFPIYHKGEGTVHDASLVPNWNDIFNENSVRLAKKYNPAWLQQYNSKHRKVSPVEYLNYMKNDNSIVFNEVIENNAYKADDNLLNKNILDVGANIGCYSLLASYYGAKKVVAVEPVADTFNFLVKNIAASGFKNITPVKKIVWSTDNAEQRISSNSLHNGVNGLYAQGEKWETIKTITLNTLLKEFDDNNIILKLDCEGSEYDILLNASQEDMNRISYIHLEIHTQAHPQYKGYQIIADKLRSFGYHQEYSTQMYSWDIDSNGNRINYKPLGVMQEGWSR